MYTKDKTKRITLRLNDEQFEFVQASAEPLGVSPSEFLRMVVNATMAASKISVDRLRATIEKETVGIIKDVKEEGIRRENETPIQHDQL